MIMKVKPAVGNLLDISLLSGRSIDSLVAEYHEAGYGTTLSKLLPDSIIATLEPIQAEYHRLDL